MKAGDVVTVGSVVLGLGILAAVVFLAPPAPETEVGYAPVEVTGMVITSAVNTTNTVVAVGVTMPQAGFVTIHKAYGQAPGPVVYTSGYLQAGTTMTSGLTTEALVPGDTYIALMHLDNGDEEFVMEEDLPVMSNGQVSRFDFIAEDKSAPATE